MTVDIKVPALGESVTEGRGRQMVQVAVGEAVGADEPLVELETDKVTLEVNAPAAGVLAEIVAAEGAEVAVGAVLGRIDETGSAVAAAPGQRCAGTRRAGPGTCPRACSPAAQPGGAQAGRRARSRPRGHRRHRQGRPPAQGRCRGAPRSAGSCGRECRRAGARTRSPAPAGACAETRRETGGGGGAARNRRPRSAGCACPACAGASPNGSRKPRTARRC